MGLDGKIFGAHVKIVKSNLEAGEVVINLKSRSGIGNYLEPVEVEYDSKSKILSMWMNKGECVGIEHGEFSLRLFPRSPLSKSIGILQ